jgi:hypothetical protein
MWLTSLFRKRCRTNREFNDLQPIGSQITRTTANISAAGLVIASAGLGAIFAFNAGKQHGVLMAGLMTTFAVALELAKPIAVSSAFAAFRNWAVVRGAALSMLAAVAIGYSLTAELSLMATARGDLAAQRVADTKAAKSVDGRRERIGAELTKLANTRPAATIKAEIAGILADQRLGDCRAMYTHRAKAECPRVNGLRAELGNAERREKLEADLASLQTIAPMAATDRPADPGAHALSVYLAALGIVVSAGLLSQWLTLVPVIGLEVGAALSLLLVQSVSGGRSVLSSKEAPERVDAPAVIETTVDSRAPAHPRQPEPTRLDIKPPAQKPRTKSMRTATQRLTKRRLGQGTTLTKADAQAKLVDTLKKQGGKIEEASVRGVARLIGARRSTVHNALAALVSAGVVAKLGGVLVLRG